VILELATAVAAVAALVMLAETDRVYLLVMVA
jgi:hypothetical protein